MTEGIQLILAVILVLFGYWGVLAGLIEILRLAFGDEGDD